MKSVIAIAVASMLMISCANIPSQIYKVSSYDKAWECANTTAVRLGVRIMNSSKESGSIFGQKALDDVNISLIRKAGGIEVVINRMGNLALIPTTGDFVENYYAQYGSCVKG